MFNEFSESVLYRSAGMCPVCGELITLTDISKIDEAYKYSLETKIHHPKLQYTQCHAFMMELGKENQAWLDAKIQHISDMFTGYSQKKHAI